MQTSNNSYFLTHFNDESAEATEFRRLYSKLKHMYVNQKMKNFLVTSAKQNEGKSTTAALLGCTIAKYRDTKTILIDCDLRRPTVHQLFGLKKEGGVSEVLSGKKKLDQCFKETKIPNLKVLTAGEPTQNPTSLMNSPNLKELFSEIKFYFDTVIVDSPPVIPVTDALLLSPEMDGALIVLKAGETHKEVARRAVELMRNAGLNILGAILNNQKGVLPFYYDHNYYGYSLYHSQESVR